MIYIMKRTLCCFSLHLSQTLFRALVLVVVLLTGGVSSAHAQLEFLAVENLECGLGECPFDFATTSGTASIDLATGTLRSQSVGAAASPPDTDRAEIGLRFDACNDSFATLSLVASWNGLLRGSGGGALNFGEFELQGFLHDETDGIDVDVETIGQSEFGDPAGVNNVVIGLSGHTFELQGNIEASHSYIAGLRLVTRADGFIGPGEADFNTGFRRAQLEHVTIVLNPGLMDSDGDGLFDVWETDGILGCNDEMVLNLPELGADPNHKDIFVELDWITGSPPSAAQLALVQDAFAQAPVNAGGVNNPDGLPGINLWIDTGTGGFAEDFGGGNAISPASLPNNQDVPRLWGDADGNGEPDFFEVKAANFDAASRRLAFHYALSGPRGVSEGPGTCSDGVDNDLDGAIDSDDTDDCFGGGQATGDGNFFVASNDGGLFMHELGHNLGLNHGGRGDGTNCKPNYVSVMSYSMTSGIQTDLDGDDVPDSVVLLDYSPPRFPGGRGVAPLQTLEEDDLDDSVILDPTDNFNFFRFTDPDDVGITRALDVEADWDDDPSTDLTGFQSNINSWASKCDGALDDQTLTGNDDWTNLTIPFVPDPITGDAPPDNNPEPEPTHEELEEIDLVFNTTDLSVTKVALGDLAVAGQIVEYEITVTNNGPNPAVAPEILDTPPEDTFFVNIPEGCEVEDSGALRCPVDPLPVDESTSLILQVRLPLAQQCLDETTTTIVNRVETLNRLSNGDVAPELTPDDNVAEVETDVLCLRYEYPTKVVCGTQPDPEGLMLIRGRYATVVNIHNPNDEEVPFFEKLALAFPPVDQEAGAIHPISIDRLNYDEALKVSCDDLRESVFDGSFDEGYIDGFVVIQSPRPLDVTAVYTTGQVDERGTVVHSSIDVESVRERERPQPEPLPDLVVRNVRAEPRCFTPTACQLEASYEIHNVGDAIAGPFTAHLTLEPGAAAVDTENFPPGLAPGAFVSGSFFGPINFADLQAATDLCVTADAPIDAVEEIDETNNRNCGAL